MHDMHRSLDMVNHYNSRKSGGEGGERERRYRMERSLKWSELGYPWLECYTDVQCSISSTEPYNNYVTHRKKEKLLEKVVRKK